jgi:predicted transcriptional regulator
VKNTWFSIRLDEELHAALDNQLAELRKKGAPTTKSELARTLLAEALGSAKIRRTVIEHARTLEGRLRRAATRAVEDVLTRIPQYLDDAPP